MTDQELAESLSRDDRLWLEQLELEISLTSTASPYTITPKDDIILCDTSGGAITVNLPAAANGRRMTLLRTAGANNVTVTPSGAETINGAASATISSSWSPLRLKATNGGWYSA